MGKRSAVIVLVVPLSVFTLALMLNLAIGRQRAELEAQRLILKETLAKYSTPPKSDYWEIVGDTEEFWKDMDILYQAASHRNRDALRTLLVVGMYTDGAVSEGFPDVYQVVRRYPALASEIFLQNSKLRNEYSHWLEED